MSAPSERRRPPRLAKPRAVPPGGTLGIVAPAGPIDAERLAAGVEMLETAGFRTRVRGDVCARDGFLAGDDERRASELMEMVDDPRVDAILCARGGYGCQRMLGRLDPERVRRAAKPIVGFSDVTTLHLWLYSVARLVSFHGPMLDRGGDLGADELRAFEAALTGKADSPTGFEGEPCRDGVAEGRLVGGNLSVVTASLGTPWEVDTRGTLLLIEEVHEEPYRIDRMLGQLRAAGKLDSLAGVGVGALVECDASARPVDAAAHGSATGPTARQVIEEWIHPLGVPLVVGLPFGHAVPNLPWPLGVRARLDGTTGRLELLEAGVQ